MLREWTKKLKEIDWNINCHQMGSELFSSNKKSNKRQHTTLSGDGGIDGIINEDKRGLENIYIQAKRYGQNKVREKDIRNFMEQ